MQWPQLAVRPSSLCADGASERNSVSLAAHGLRHLCRTDDGRRRLVRAGAIEALLSCATIGASRCLAALQLSMS